MTFSSVPNLYKILKVFLINSVRIKPVKVSKAEFYQVIALPSVASFIKFRSKSFSVKTLSSNKIVSVHPDNLSNSEIISISNIDGLVVKAQFELKL